MYAAVTAGYTQVPFLIYFEDISGVCNGASMDNGRCANSSNLRHKSVSICRTRLCNINVLYFVALRKKV